MSQLYLPLDDVLVQPTSTTIAPGQCVRRPNLFQQQRTTTQPPENATPQRMLLKNTLRPNTTAPIALLALPPTRKRLQEADRQRKEAARLQRIQITLRRKLAEMHEKGTIVSELADLTSRAAVERALFAESQNSALRAICDSTDCLETSQTMAFRMEWEAMLMGIPGFFLTPPDVAEQFMQFACLGEVKSVLEPSAGSGSLIDTLRRQHPAAVISYCEINCLPTRDPAREIRRLGSSSLYRPRFL